MIENLKYHLELETAYHSLRINIYPGLDEMSKDLASKRMENVILHERKGQVPMREIRSVLGRQIDEGKHMYDMFCPRLQVVPHVSPYECEVHTCVADPTFLLYILRESNLQFKTRSAA